MEVSLGAGGAATCRCCLAPGVAAKDLSSEYDFMGEKEVYADMLLESFDITLSRAVNAGWVICDSCITRLRDSSNFKKQVLHSEKCLLQKSKAGVASTEDVAESKLELTVLKQEEDSDDDHADFETLFYDEEDHNELKKPVVKTEPLASTSNDMSNDEDVPLSSLTAGVKRKARPIKTDTLPKYLRVGPKQLKDPPVRLKVLPAASAKTAPKAPLPRPAVKVGGIKVQLAKESAQKLATSKLSGRQLKITLKNPSTAAVKKDSPAEATPSPPNVAEAGESHSEPECTSESAHTVECLPPTTLSEQPSDSCVVETDSRLTISRHSDIMFLDSKRPGHRVLLHNNYCYNKHKSFSSLTSWRCKERGVCNASLTLDNNNMVVRVAEHRCVRTTAHKEVDIALAEARKRVQVETGSVRKIYAECISKLNPDIDLAAVPNFKSVQTSLYNIRNKSRVVDEQKRQS